MRKARALLVIALLAPAAGCPEGMNLNILRPAGTNTAKGPQPQAPAREDLVAYLNNNSAAIPGIQSSDVRLTYYVNPITPIPIDATLAAQGPRKFRMAAKMAGQTEVDLGSNDQEFWYWIKRGDPHQFYCSYKALEEGQVKEMPFPFQPDWVLESMGMGKYGPAEKYELVVDTSARPQWLKLIERTKSPSGRPVKKIIVFNYNLATGDKPQVTDYQLIDEATNKLVCGAHITKKQKLQGGGEIPLEIELRWPEQKLKLGLEIHHPRVSQDFAPNVYVRHPLNNIASYNLATGRLDPITQAGAMGTPSPIR
jgi:hypothetical protein